jgi:parallel beta-helix repeat protein
MKENNKQERIIPISLAAILVFTVFAAPASAADYHHVGPGQTYSAIQDAINASNPHDTIIVHDGTYNENLDVNVTHLTIQSENGSAVTIVQAVDSDDDVFEVIEDYVNISGFTATGATGSCGIYLGSGTDHCNISNNNASNNSDGIHLRDSSNNRLTGNTANSNGDGIYMRWGSDNNTLTNNIANSNGVGIDLWDASNNVLINNTANLNRRDGIEVRWGSDNNVLANNTANSNRMGIELWDSSNNVLTNNTMSGNEYNFGVRGQLSYYSQQDIDTSNKVDGRPIYYWVNQQDKQVPNDAGYVGIVGSTNITVRDLVLTNNYIGVLFADTRNSRIENVTVSNNEYLGIYLYYSDDNRLTNNIADSNCGGGIYLQYSSNNRLTNNTANSNNHCTTIHHTLGYGICMRFYSNNNTLTNNTANSNHQYGFYFGDSSNNRLTNNTANLNDWYGICLDYSGNNKLTSNTMSGNKYNFGVFGWRFDYIQDLDTSNVVDGKPIYYWVDQHDKQVPNDAGFVGVVSSTNITVRDLILTKNGEGVLFVDSQDSRIENLNVSNNSIGIYLYYSSENNLTNNTANLNSHRSRAHSSTSGYGIHLDHSSNNNLVNNTANLNSQHGIYLEDWSDDNNLVNNTANLNSQHGIYLEGKSNNNMLTNTTANSNSKYGICVEYSSDNRLTNITTSNNDYGIYLKGSSNNLIYNNYFNNTNNAWDDGTNTWNITAVHGTNIIGGPYLGGNYWSDYAGADTDGDGLGDTLRPYNSSGNIQNAGDWHPLVSVLSRTCTISLDLGWNLISAPLNLTIRKLGQESIVGDPLNVTPENRLTSIYRYNTTSELFEKCSHYDDWGWDPATGSESFTELEPGRGYWVMAKNDCNLTFTGTAPSDLNVPLDAGWNCVGWYSMSEAQLGEEAVVGDPLNVTPENSLTSIYQYNSSTGLFEKCSHYDDWGWYPATGSESFTELEPGRGYWGMAKNDCEWRHEV